MARIRSIHPTLSTDEAFMAMTITAKAVWPMLWMECDDSGVFEWKPIVLKARLLPADNVDMAAVLSEYESLNTVMKFEVDGREYGVIRNFVRFQRPKDPKSVHPTPPAVRKYAGFNDNGSRPNAGTGRPSTGGKEKVLPKSFVTTSEVQPQMKEEGGRREDEGGGSEPKGSGAPAPVVPIDARTALFRDGLKSLQILTGKPEAGCRTLVGKWLRDAKDNAKAVHNAIRSAEEVRAVDPVPWIERALRQGDDDEVYRGVL
jgi:hypothetical protein